MGRETDRVDSNRGQDATPLVTLLAAGAGNTSLPRMLSGHWKEKEEAWQPEGFLSQLQGAPLWVAEGVGWAEGEVDTVKTADMDRLLVMVREGESVKLGEEEVDGEIEGEKETRGEGEKMEKVEEGEGV